MTTPETQGEVSPESMRKTASSAVRSPADAKPAPPRTTGNTADQNRLKRCSGKQFRAMGRDLDAGTSSAQFAHYVMVEDLMS